MRVFHHSGTVVGSPRFIFLTQGREHPLIYRLILPEWKVSESPSLKRVLEGKLGLDYVLDQNTEHFYNSYYLPNYPSHYEAGTTVDGSQVDTFTCVFIDMDLKEKKHESKDNFLSVLRSFDLPPSAIVDSGNGIHAYWRVDDLDAMGFLRLQRRLCRHFQTDEAVSKIYQLMRVPGTVNTKNPEDFKLCEVLEEFDISYTCEDLDKLLPPITREDEEYCKRHYEQTYRLKSDIKVDDRIPQKFATLLRDNKEVKEIWAGNVDDRSAGDWRLGHIMFANGFTREEALSVLVNCAKAIRRAPTHRLNYAENIVGKIWTFEESPKDSPILAKSVKDILSRGTGVVHGTRMPCHRLIDDTQVGFRLGHFLGLIAGSGVGKTAMAVNMFRWFAEGSPEYDHLFVSLEQPEEEIALRWQSICGDDSRLQEKVHILSNYDQSGSFRNLSLDDITGHIAALEASTGRKVGCCVIDHIGVLAKPNKNGEGQGIIDVMKAIKPFCIKNNVFLVMQSQAPREKAGIGDLELNKDAAYGSVFFESYADWLVTLWQPLKRLYADGAPTVMSFKFAKIRHKKQNKDKIKEDVRYNLFFDPETEQLRELTEIEEKSFNYFNAKCASLRNQDRKTEVLPYTSRKIDQKETPNVGTTDTSTDTSGVKSAGDLLN